MANRYLVRTRAGDHIAASEAQILEWLRQGHCSCGDFVFVEAEGKWKPISELGEIAPLFASRPTTKLEKPVITVFRLGYGRSLQQGPFTLSTVLDMLARGEVCAYSWIFVEGDKEWRQVKNVKILREAIPAAPKEAPRFELTAVAGAAGEADNDISFESLQSGLGIESDTPSPGTSEPTQQSQPSIVPLPEGVRAEPPVQVATKTGAITKTATLTKTVSRAMDEALSQVLESNSPPEQPARTTAGFMPTPDFAPSAGAGAAAVAYALEEPAAASPAELSVKLEVSPPASAVPAPAPKTAAARPPAAPPVAPPAAPPVAPPAAPPATPPDDPKQRFEYRQQNAVEEIPEEEQTKAVSKLGLAEGLAPAPDFQQHRATSPGFVPAPDLTAPTPPPLRPAAKAPPKAAGKSVPPPSPGAKGGEDSEEGIIVEIPQEPIWMIKQDKTDRLSGPYSFQEIIDLLGVGRLTKDDKISKQGTNRFCKIAQQYEFNVKHTIETVVENGVERQKILIKRRHPRVSYMTDVHVMKVGRKWLGKCVNISAGGILLESSDLEVALGEQVMIEIMPGLIPRKISVSALVIGKIPKKPPGFALRFTDLKVEDKEAIEFFVMEILKKEKAMGI